jgi:anthranilate phosphoribosyltransferase
MDAFKPIIAKVATGSPLSREEARDAFDTILSGGVTLAQAGAFLMALRVRGETVDEIAGAVSAMRDKMLRVTAPADAIDIVGTGGDNSGSWNVSTLAAIIVAACGVPVAKHGNRAASSKAGAADTLEALGLNLAHAGERAESTLNDIGIAFLFAQAHHPSLKHIAPIRRALGCRTIFNLMGPLANPADVQRQLVGIARPDYVPIYAEAIRRLGTARSFVISGDEGLDELSLAGGNEVADVRHDAVAMRRVSPSDAGLPEYPVEAIKGGDPAYNADALRRLLMGEHGPYRDAVLLNAAGALMVAGEVSDWREGAEEAAEAIDKGLAKGLLDCWIKACA